MVKLRFVFLLGWFLSLMISGQSLAQEDVKITAKALNGGVIMLMGKGGNIGVFSGDDGTFMIDDQFAPLTSKILAAIKSAGGEAPRFIINTHFHGDHTGGNENLGKRGALIVSHENVRERLAADSIIKAFGMRMKASPGVALPVVTFSKDVSFHINGDTLRAIHSPFAHTDGDSFIQFEKANVIHAGDLFFNGFYPFIDADHGGTLKGMIAGADRMLALADSNTQIIPGHGPLANKIQLEKYRNMMQTAYKRLRALKDQGKTAKEAVAANPLADLEPVWGKGIFSGEKWIHVIYPGVR